MLSVIKHSATVYLDAPPLSRSIHQLTDYSSYLMYNLCALPLLKFDEAENNIQPLAAKNWKISKNATFFEFFLRDDLYWSNGEKVNAMDYCRAFHFILKDRKNRFRNMLSDIIGYDTFIRQNSSALAGIRAEGNTLGFHLEKPNYFFLSYLSLLIFSPLHAEHSHLFCGAYYLHQRDDFCLKLKQNPWFKIDEKPESIETITFVHEFNAADPFALNAFNKGDIDVTSDTAFPYEQYREYAQKESIMKTWQTGISCTLSENKNTSVELTRLMIHGINRTKIIHALHNIPEINSGYYNLYDISEDTFDPLYDRDLAFSLVSEIKNPAEISIAYENYYPNREILEGIAEQLSPLGLRFKFLEEAYGARNVDSDYRLELRKSPIPDPLFFYKNALKSKGLSRDKYYQSCFSELLKQYQETEAVEKRRAIALKMDRLLITLGQYVPLIKIPGICLKNPAIKNASLFIPGQLWYI